MTITLRLILVFCLSTLSSFGQTPKKPTSSEIFESIKKLNFLGTVLYVAAHPDDENTRLISYMANHQKARTAYLSMTRGDGGQNLIGPEIRELLGVIRTQELLAARNIDGGEQMFTRANDFGYSKSPEETLKIWNKEEVLSDVVLAIRKFKPDIIINRFDHRTPGRTHGHHTSSAMLSLEAFDLAGDKTKFQDQLDLVEPWQPKRLFFNTSWWFYGSQENFEKADKSNLLSFDTGTYSPLTGLSNPEIAALSRTSHKSQGFGSTGSRGEQIEYIEILKGKIPNDKANLFDGIDTSWNKLKNGKPIGDALENIINNFDFKNPSNSVPRLLQVYTMIDNLEDSHWKNIKLEELKEIIAHCSGIFLEAVSRSQLATNNETIQIELEAINRSDLNISLISTQMVGRTDKSINKKLENNQNLSIKDSVTINSNQKPTTPYWLTDKGSLGMYKVDDLTLIGTPETPRHYKVAFKLDIEGTPLTLEREVVYKTNDPVKGEIYRPFEIIPMASSRFLEEVILFKDDTQKDIQLAVRAGIDDLEGFASIDHPEDWQVFPEKQKFSIANKGEEQFLTFTIIPPKNQSEAYFKPKVSIGNKTFDKQLIEMDYDHIPYQTILVPAEAKVVKLNFNKLGENIAYIEGAGDVVPESLRNIGYNVAILKPEDISKDNLERFDAVVMGIRAYNVVDELQFKQPILFDYVKEGGNLVIQYNTSRGVKVEQIAPYELTLSRDRVTDEESEVTFVNAGHEVLNFPNKITKDDFEGWTQERGLYFPDEWGPEFTPILSMKDEGEEPVEGALLIAKHGKGNYIYTGLSFFREFPAGVAGAYRLFANILSLGKNDLNTDKPLED